MPNIRWLTDRFVHLCKLWPIILNDPFNIFQKGVEIYCSNRKNAGADFNAKNTSGEQIAFMMRNFLEFRDGEAKKLENDSNLELGEVTTVNLSILEGDSRPNDNSKPFKAVFDIRISVNMDVEEFEKQVIYQT